MYFAFSLITGTIIGRASSGTKPTCLALQAAAYRKREGDMDKRRSGAPLVLICMLAACSGDENDGSSSQAPVADTSVAGAATDPQPQGNPLYRSDH